MLQLCCGVGKTGWISHNYRLKARAKQITHQLLKKTSCFFQWIAAKEEGLQCHVCVEAKQYHKAVSVKLQICLI